MTDLVIETRFPPSEVVSDAVHVVNQSPRAAVSVYKKGNRWTVETNIESDDENEVERVANAAVERAQNTHGAEVAEDKRGNGNNGRAKVRANYNARFK